MSKNCNPLEAHEFDKKDYMEGSDRVLVASDVGDVPQYRVENESKHYLQKLRLTESNGKRCDFLVLDCTVNSAYFVELKGKNLSGAVKQVMSTIEVFSGRMKSFKFYCRIVQTSVIRATAQTEKAKLHQYLKEKHKHNYIGKIEELIKLRVKS